MISPTIGFSVVGVVLSYFILKNQTLNTPAELQEEIESRLQPKYPISEPTNTSVLPHTDWPSKKDFYVEVWHTEVTENRWGQWKKWLPFGGFRGSTIVKYRIQGFGPLPRKILNSHHLARQPYIRSLRVDQHDPHQIKVIYETVDPSQISTFVRQFKYLIRDSTFRYLNPNSNIRYEVLTDGDDEIYARIFDANESDPIGPEEAARRF